MGRGLGLKFNKGNILSPMMKYRRKYCLRHSQKVHREEDGAIHFWSIKENLQNQFPHSPQLSDSKRTVCLEEIREDSSTVQSSGAPTGDLIPTRWPFCAPSANPLRANATSLRPRLSFTGCTPAELLRFGDGQHARFAPVGQRLLLWWIWIWMPSTCWGPAVAPGSPLLPIVPVPCLLALPSLPPGFFASGSTPALRFC